MADLVAAVNYEVAMAHSAVAAVETTMETVVMVGHTAAVAAVLFPEMLELMAAKVEALI